jgi:anti-sigma B factor antagonist
VEERGHGGAAFDPLDFDVRSEVHDPATVVAVRGEVDMNTAPRLEETLLAACDAAPQSLVLDLCEVEFIDSSALRVIILAAERLETSGRRLHVACAAGPIRRLLELTGVAVMVEIHENGARAIAAAT